MNRQLFWIICLSLCLISCGKVDRVNTSENIKVTIKIEDGIDNNQKYLLRIQTNGKQINEKAIFPQDLSLITNEKKEAITNLSTNVSYIISVYKANLNSIDEYFSKPKPGSKKTNENIMDNPLSTTKVIPTVNTKTINIVIRQK